MPERDQNAYFEDILKSCEKIIKYIDRKTFDENNFNIYSIHL